MKQEHKIRESLDCEFLSFLYAEREREYAMSSAWGINYWVVGAAILGLLGYAYSQISKDYESFNWHIFTYYAVVQGAILNSLATMLSPLMHNHGWKSGYRVTTLFRNYPIDEINGKNYVAFACFIAFVTCWKEYCIVTWLFLSIVILELGIKIFVTIKGQQLVKVEPIGRVFPKNGWEFAYRMIDILLCWAIITIAIYTWGAQYPMAPKEFEMSCVLAIIIGSLWITYNRIREGKSQSIDELIDKYVYGSLSKEDAFFYLQSYTQGYDILDILHTECEEIKPFMQQMVAMREKHANYRSLIAEGKLEFKDCATYLNDVKEDAKVTDQALIHAHKLRDKLNEVLLLETHSESLELLKKKIEEIRRIEKELLEFVNDSQAISRQILDFLESFMCSKYGALCDKMDCKERNEKYSFWYVLKRFSFSKRNASRR